MTAAPRTDPTRGVIVLRWRTGLGATDIGIRTAQGYRGGSDDRCGWATHVEAVMPDGNYLGAHIDLGVRSRPPDYDQDWTKQIFVEIPCGDVPRFIRFLGGHVGEPYDTKAILGFVLHEDMHMPMHAICSALQELALRSCGVFGVPLAKAAHMISPSDLLLIISSHVLVGDPEVRVLAA